MPGFPMSSAMGPDFDAEHDKRAAIEKVKLKMGEKQEDLRGDVRRAEDDLRHQQLAAIQATLDEIVLRLKGTNGSPGVFKLLDRHEQLWVAQMKVNEELLSVVRDFNDIKLWASNRQKIESFLVAGGILFFLLGAGFIGWKLLISVVKTL